MRLREIISETATVGATSAASIGTVVSPHLAIGKKRGKKVIQEVQVSPVQRLLNLPKLFRKRIKMVQLKTLLT